MSKAAVGAHVGCRCGAAPDYRVTYRIDGGPSETRVVCAMHADALRNRDDVTVQRCTGIPRTTS